MSETPSTPLPDYPPAKGLPLIARAFITIAVLVLGVIGMIILVAGKKPAIKKAETAAALVIEAIEVMPGPQRLTVNASGTVVPARQVVIGAEVAGRVVVMAPDLVPGGRFRAGQALLRVDARDYQLAVEQQNAQVTIARTELEVEKSRKRVAEQEAAIYGGSGTSELALRDPQLKTAEGAVKAAESGLRRTRLAVSKTGVVAPFPAMVLTRNVDLGQLVSPGMSLATLVGTDAFWIQVSVPVDRLGDIDVPGVSGATVGSRAVVRQRVGDRVVEREGRVVRVTGDLDPVGRMARVIVEVADPLALRPGARELPLLLNAYVDVEIDGDDVAEVYEIPRAALRDDTTVWLNEGDVLRHRAVQVVARRPSSVVVRGELGAKPRVITSPVSVPIDGSPVREVTRKAAAPAGHSPAPAAPTTVPPTEPGTAPTPAPETTPAPATTPGAVPAAKAGAK